MEYFRNVEGFYLKFSMNGNFSKMENEGDIKRSQKTVYPGFQNGIYAMPKNILLDWPLGY